MAISNPPSLQLDQLSSGFKGVTPALGKSYTEAASVCFDEQGHLNGNCRLTVRSDERSQFTLHWLQVTDQMKRSYADYDEATEWGAICVALIVVKELTGMTVFERSYRGTGFDYYIGLEAVESRPFDNKARLEISGLRKATSQKVTARVRKKCKQTQVSDGCLPALVAVVEFSQPLAQVVKR